MPQQTREWNPHLVGLKAQLEPPLFPGAHLTHFTCESSQNCSQSLFNQCVGIIQCVSASVSVSVCQTLPFSLCVVQHCISLGYPPQGPNNTTSWWKLGEFFCCHDASFLCSLLSNLTGMILNYCYQTGMISI